MSDLSISNISPGKRCRDCGEVKPAGEFWTNQNSPDGLA